MSKEVITLSAETWDKIRLQLSSVSLSRLHTEPSFDGPPNPVSNWVLIHEDLSTFDEETGWTYVYEGYITYYDAPTASWGQDSSPVKVLGPSNERLVVGERYYCTCWGENGTVDSISAVVDEGDYPLDSEGRDVATVWMPLFIVPEPVYGKILAYGDSACGPKYSWEQWRPTDCGWESVGVGSGSGAIVSVSQSSIAPPQSWTIQLSGATSGQFSVSYDSSLSAGILWNASAADIDTAIAAAGGGTTTTTDLGGGTFLVTAADMLAHTMSLGVDSLGPAVSFAAYEFNGKKVANLPQFVEMRPGGGGPASVSIVKEHDGILIAVVSLIDVLSGTFHLVIDTVTYGPFNPDESAASIQAATGLVTTGSDGGPWSIQFADDDHHSVEEFNDLIGTTTYVFAAPYPNPAPCKIGEVRVEEIDGWTDTGTQVLSYDPANGCLKWREIADIDAD